MKINEIFTSIDGEVNRFGQGGFTTFIRLQGCNLDCSYCDTKHARDPEGGTEMSLKEIMKEVEAVGCKKVTLTGGEPLLQWSDCSNLIQALIGKDYRVTIETNGTIPTSYLPMRHPLVGWVIDYKLECSDKMAMSNFDDLIAYNWVKFVITDRNKYDQAKQVTEMLRKYHNCKAKIAFSPAASNSTDIRTGASDLFSWMYADGLFDVYLNVQLHKIIAVK